MNCERWTEWIGEAVDGTLDAERQAQLDAHCRGCESCRDLLNDLMDIRAAASTLDRITPSPALWNAIAAKIGDRDARFRVRRWVPLAAAAPRS